VKIWINFFQHFAPLEILLHSLFHYLLKIRIIISAKASALNTMIAGAYNENNIRCSGTLINQKIS